MYMGVGGVGWMVGWMVAKYSKKKQDDVHIPTKG